MKKIFLSAVILALVTSIFLFAGCNGSGYKPEYEFRYLLVTQYEKAESENWTVDQFIAHADSERTPHFIELGVGVFRRQIPSIYLRAINLDAGEITHAYKPHNRLGRETPYDGLSLTASGFFGVNDTAPDFDVVEVLSVRDMAGNTMTEAGTISFRVVNLRGW